jgi:O-antigen/teichoic acid export membrane protein
MKQDLKKFFSYSIPLNIVTILFGILGYRLLGPEEVGKLNVVIQVVMSLSMLITLSLPEMLARFLPSENDKNRSSIFQNSLYISYFFFSVIVVILIILKTLNLIILPQEVEKLFFFIIFNIFIQVSINFLFAYLKGVGSFISYLKYEGLLGIVSRFFGIAAFLSLYHGYESFYFAQLSILTIIFFILMYKLKFIFSIKKLILDKEKVKYTAVLFIGSLIYIGATSIDIFAIRYFLDVKNVGLFTAAIMVPKTIQIVFLSKLQVPFLYYFSSGKSTISSEYIVENGTLIIGSIAGILSLLIAFQADNIIYYTFGADYLDSIIVLQIFSIHFFLVGILSFSGIYFNAKNKPSKALYIGALGFFINIILDIILIPKYGLSGAAIGHISSLFIQIILYFVFLKVYKINMKKSILVIVPVLIGYFLIILDENYFYFYFIPLLVYLVNYKFLDIQLIKKFLKKDVK